MNTLSIPRSGAWGNLSNTFFPFAVFQTKIEHIRFALPRLSVGGVIESAKLAREFGENFQHVIQVLFGMSGHIARAHDRLAITNGRIDGRSGEYSFLVKALRIGRPLPRCRSG